MIIAFACENWLSFRDRVTFSMLASRERQHNQRLAKLGKYQMRIVPITALYGGNASGKSNFFKAMAFVERLVVDGTRLDRPIPVVPFLLDAGSAAKPSRFDFTLLINETIYEFSFALTRKAILEEKLVTISNTMKEKLCYHRHKDEITFDKSVDEKERLEFVFAGTQDNQLFLNNAVSQKVEAFRPVYDWFRDTLQLVAPDARFQPFWRFIDEEHPLPSKMKEVLPKLDTGIVRLGSEDHPLENISLPEQLKTRLQEELKEGETVVIAGKNNKRFVVSLKDGELIARKLVSYHQKNDDDGSEVQFEIAQESDGSRRLIELLPAFFALSDRSQTKVYVFDEIDRSLHPLLIRELLEAYLDSCDAASRSQLLLTTHNVLLMDQALLRRDEMWVSERGADEVSSLIPFSDYKDIRYDKDIRKSYLQGRLGGIPRILPGITLPNRKQKQRERSDVAEKKI